MKITGNEPAMPFFKWNEAGYGDAICIYSQDGSKQILPYELGLTIRQQFAMAAMQALISQAQSSESAQDKYTCNGGLVEPYTISKNSVIFADALIAELNRTEEQK